MKEPCRFTVVRAHTMRGTAPRRVSVAAGESDSEFTASTATGEASLCMAATNTYGRPPSAPAETQSTVSLSVSTTHPEAEIDTSPALAGNVVSGTFDGTKLPPESTTPASGTLAGPESDHAGVVGGRTGLDGRPGIGRCQRAAAGSDENERNGEQGMIDATIQLHLTVLLGCDADSPCLW